MRTYVCPKSVPGDRTRPVNAVEASDVDDLTSLRFLDEPNILHTLRIRFARDAIYTYTVYAVIVMYTRIASLSHDIPRSPTLSPSLSLTHYTRTHTHTHVHAHTHSLTHAL